MDRPVTKKVEGWKTEPPEDLLDVEKRFDLYLRAQQAQIAAQKLGLGPAQRPSVDWADPEDITILDEQDVQRLSWLISQWIGYAEGIVSIADIDKTGADAALDFISEAVVTLQETKSVTEAKARAAIDTRVDSARQRFLDKDAKWKLARSKLKEYQKKSESLSRELSWRQYSLDKFKSGF